MSPIMRNEKPLFLRILLWPFAAVYGLVVTLRNVLFDWEILPSKKFEIPIVSIGNITVGGTGKTPFSEYIIRLLKEDFHVGFLSRGYKRKTKGFQLADEKSTPATIGDEPYQVKSKFPDIMVAVDAKRTRGIVKMQKEAFNRPDIIILDDAYQHRYVSPDLNILLIDYNRMITEDHLLPVGNLREPISSTVRADIVVLTKCPTNLQSIEFRIIRKNLKLYPYQALYFSSLAYDEPQPVFQGSSCNLTSDTTVLTLTGIAAPKPFEDYVHTLVNEVASLNYADHHTFKKSDMVEIEKTFNAITNPKKIILTTEKDAVRLKNSNLFPESLKGYIFYIPLQIKFLKEEGEEFNMKIHSFLRKNKYFSQLLDAEKKSNNE